MAIEALTAIESNWVVTSLFLLVILPVLAMFNDDLK